MSIQPGKLPVMRYNKKFTIFLNVVYCNMKEMHVHSGNIHNKQIHMRWQFFFKKGYGITPILGGKGR